MRMRVILVWFSELYNRVPFAPRCDRILHDLTLPIQHGCFYWEDSYPDSHLFADAEMLRQSHTPDFMLVRGHRLSDSNHGGSLPDVRETLLFCIGP